MPPKDEPKPLAAGLKGPAGEFAEYCTAEFQRRAGSGEEFDPELYKEAVQFVLSKLQKNKGGQTQ